MLRATKNRLHGFLLRQACVLPVGHVSPAMSLLAIRRIICLLHLKLCPASPFYQRLLFEDAMSGLQRLSRDKANLSERRLVSSSFLAKRCATKSGQPRSRPSWHHKRLADAAELDADQKLEQRASAALE